MAFVYLSAKEIRKGLDSFKKLRDASQEDRDYETKLYAY